MRLKLGHTLTVLVAIACTVQAAELLSTSTAIDEKDIVTFTLTYDSYPDFHLDSTGHVPDAFRITTYHEGVATSVIKGDEWFYGERLPIHYVDDPEPLVLGQWKAWVFMSLQPDNTLSFSAHKLLLGVSDQFTYQVQQYRYSVLAQTFGCQSTFTCLPTVAVAEPPSTPEPTSPPAPESCQRTGTALWFSTEKGDRMNTLAAALTLTPVLYLVACGSGGTDVQGTGTTPAPAATVNSQYIIKFKSAEIRCVIDNPNVSEVAVFRQDQNGTLYEIQSCGKENQQS